MFSAGGEPTEGNSLLPFFFLLSRPFSLSENLQEGWARNEREMENQNRSWNGQGWKRDRKLINRWSNTRVHFRTSCWKSWKQLHLIQKKTRWNSSRFVSDFQRIGVSLFYYCRLIYYLVQRSSVPEFLEHCSFCCCYLPPSCVTIR